MYLFIYHDDDDDNDHGNRDSNYDNDVETMLKMKKVYMIKA